MFIGLEIYCVLFSKNIENINRMKILLLFIIVPVIFNILKTNT